VDQPNERRIVIMGAGGRDFHTFLTTMKNDPAVRVAAITATQIPYISDRRLPASLAGERYPDGIRITDEENLLDVLKEENADEVVFAYSDVSHDYVEEKRKLVEGAGVAFRTFDVDATMVKSTKPVVAVTAVRTGCGKSAVSRYVIKALAAHGLKSAAIRHPMPYGDLGKQAVQRFETMQDLIDHECTIKEREEYEPHIAAGSIVFAGVDYEAIVRKAEEEVDVVLWDGGNNDTPFYKPDVWITLGDPMRPGHEKTYFPGDDSFARSDILVLTKVDSASPEGIAALEASAAELNPNAVLLKASLPISLSDEDAARVKGKRVLVVEDGPTVTHGGMKTGAGTIAAERYGAAEIVDPRPFVKGELQDTFDSYPGIGILLPAMGYSDQQIADLEETINSSDVDLVVIGTPLNLGTLINIDKPYVWATYEAAFDGQDLGEIMMGMLKEKGLV
jgi:predicted GTPase